MSLTRGRWATVALTAAVLALVLFVVPALARPSAARPWANAVVYTLDVDRGEAQWVTFNDSRAGRGVGQQLDEWTRQFFTAGAEETTFDPWLLTRSDTPYPALRSTAPLVALPHTKIAGEGARLVVVRPPEAWLTRLVMRSTAPLSGVTLDGEALDLGGERPAEYTFLLIGRDDEVTIELATTGDVSIDVLDRLTTDVTDVARQAGLAIAPRPSWMTTSAAADTADGALVRKTLER
jgi:hypothetical protein